VDNLKTADLGESLERGLIERLREKLIFAPPIRPVKRLFVGDGVHWIDLEED
jgi:hypothetical protein